MSVNSLLKDDGAIYRLTKTKQSGGRFSDEWVFVDTVKCSVQMFYLQSGMTKVTEGGNHLENTVQVFLAADSIVLAGDRLVIDSTDVYYIRSKPNKIKNLRTGKISHLEAIADLDLDN